MCRDDVPTTLLGVAIGAVVGGWGMGGVHAPSLLSTAHLLYISLLFGCPTAALRSRHPTPRSPLPISLWPFVPPSAPCAPALTSDPACFDAVTTPTSSAS
jgi:hypothetical protein